MEFFLEVSLKNLFQFDFRKMFTAKENATEEADDTEEAEIFQDKLTDEGREKIQVFFISRSSRGSFMIHFLSVSLQY